MSPNKPAKREKSRASLGDITRKDNPPAADDESFEVVLHDKLPSNVDASDQENIDSVARTTAMRALDNATWESTDDTMAFGNSRGLSLLQERNDLTRLPGRITLLEEQIKSIIEERDNNKEVKELREEVKAVKAIQQVTLPITLQPRSRFIEVYKRDVLKDEIIGYNAIARGNESAHTGNCVVDALLYEQGIRTDHFVFTLLYGFTYDQVLVIHGLGNINAIKAITQRGTLKAAQNSKPWTSQMTLKFDCYMVSQLHDLSQDPTTPQSSTLALKYNDFWKSAS